MLSLANLGALQVVMTLVGTAMVVKTYVYPLVCIDCIDAEFTFPLITHE